MPFGQPAAESLRVMSSLSSAQARGFTAQALVNTNTKHEQITQIQKKTQNTNKQHKYKKYKKHEQITQIQKNTKHEQITQIQKKHKNKYINTKNEGYELKLEVLLHKHWSTQTQNTNK